MSKVRSDQENDQEIDQVSDHEIEQVSDQVSNQVSNQESNQESNQVSDQVNDQVNDQESDQVNDQVSDQVIAILKYCIVPKSRLEILSYIGLKNHFDNCKRHIEPLLEKGWLERTIPDNPKNRNQKYRTTEPGKKKLKGG